MGLFKLFIDVLYKDARLARKARINTLALPECTDERKWSETKPDVINQLQNYLTTKEFHELLLKSGWMVITNGHYYTGDMYKLNLMVNEMVKRGEIKLHQDMMLVYCRVDAND